jgi:hypothetical protein
MPRGVSLAGAADTVNYPFHAPWEHQDRHAGMSLQAHGRVTCMKTESGLPHHLIRFTLWIGILLIGSPLGAQDLGEITREIKSKRMRASSGLFDPESNQDALTIAPRATATLAELDGPGEIRHMWFTIGAEDRRYTRSVVLRIYWDGADAPSVESPIGDFFAAGNGMRANVDSLPIEVTSYGRAFNSYWRMPFRKKARITMTNESDTSVSSCYYYIDWLKPAQLPPDSLYFHARYKQEFPPKPFSSYTIADIRGKGHYVGTLCGSAT